MTGTCPACGKPLDEKTFSEDALIVMGHWQEKTGHRFRTEKASERALARIQKRLKEGFTVKQLCLCADVATGDKFYRENGYHRQPEVVWKDAERVESLLERAKRLERGLPV